MVLLALFMLFKRQSFAITKKETSILVALGILFAMSSLTLFLSFHYMGAGIACTLLFVYPVMVAVMMTVFFKEKLTIITILSIILALSGIALLYKGNDGDVLNITGVILVMISSLTYAIYIIVVNKSPLRISSVKLTFYVLLFGVISLIIIRWQVTKQLYSNAYDSRDVVLCVDSGFIPNGNFVIVDGCCCSRNRLNTYSYNGGIRAIDCRCDWSGDVWRTADIKNGYRSADDIGGCTFYYSREIIDCKQNNYSYRTSWPCCRKTLEMEIVKK